MARRAEQQDALGMRLSRQMRAPGRQEEAGDQSWLTLRRAGRPHRPGRTAILPVLWSVAFRQARSASASASAGGSAGSRGPAASGRLYVLFAFVMDVVMTLDVLLAHSMRSLRRLRASLRHSTTGMRRRSTGAGCRRDGCPAALRSKSGLERKRHERPAVPATAPLDGWHDLTKLADRIDKHVRRYRGCVRRVRTAERKTFTLRLPR